MNLVLEVLGFILGLYIRFYRMGLYNVYINNIIDNMYLICIWNGVWRCERFNCKYDIKKILGFIFIELKL